MKFLFNYAFAAMFAVLSAGPALCAGMDAGQSDKTQLKKYYDKAFEYYVSGDYQKAVEQWNVILRLDPNQVTARNMIEEARQKMSKTLDGIKTGLRALIVKGAYKDALVKTEGLLAEDSTNPSYLKIQRRIKKIAAIAEKKPNDSRPWNVAAGGLAAYLDEPEDSAFAYDSLQYALELLPKETRFRGFLDLLEEERPELKANNDRPAGTGLIEHKKNVALHYIYDSKFYLAVKELQTVLRLEPQDVTALKRLGSAYLQMKDYKRARASWQKALEITPADSQLKEYIEALDQLPK